MSPAGKRKILILYTELAGYTIACIHAYLGKYPQDEIHLVRWPVNNEAPFDFSFGAAIRVYERKSFDRQRLLQLAEKISPDGIICSGWIDKDYVQVCRAWNHKIPVVLVMDNKWLGTMKQQLARLVSGFSVQKQATYAWVPGTAQKEYALRLGFKEANIRTGFYSADLGFFNQQFSAAHEYKQQHFPHRFIYSGRYYDFKGVREMWNAFIKWKETSVNDWELWCLGTGDIPPVQHPAIRHFGFVQPSELAAVLKDAGVFILPSRVEPWAVVVHEFAAAGFPLLLSDAVGAASAFLREGENGFVFRAGDEAAIARAFSSIAKMTDEQLNEMGAKSHAVAQSITPETWADTLHSLITRQ